MWRPAFIRAMLLATALLAGAAGARAQSADQRVAVPSMTVDGVATREVAPDLAVISVGVTTDRPTATDASAQNSRTAAALLDEVKAAGIPDRDVQTVQSSLTPVFDTDRTGATGTKIKAFHAANLVEIRVRDLTLVGPLVGRLVDKGANTLQGIDFMLGNPAAVYDELRTEAVRDARRKAQIYADAAGVRLGRILGIAPDGAAPMPLRMAAPRQMKADSILASGPVPTPLQAGLQSLDTRVGVTWELLQ